MILKEQKFVPVEIRAFCEVCGEEIQCNIKETFWRARLKVFGACKCGTKEMDQYYPQPIYRPVEETP